MTHAARFSPAAAEVYAAYGLAIWSEIPLPELAPGNPGAAPDLSILRLPVPAALLPDAAAGFRFAPGRATFRWEAVGAFAVEPGRICVDPAPGVADDIVAFPLLGPVLAVALSGAGYLVLHASAVEVAGRAVVLMGDKGAGKSTTAAALLAAGHRLIADDLVALRFDDAGGVDVMPGFPQVKLSAAALDILPAAAGTARPQAHPAIAKTRFRLAGGFARGPVPLGRLYLLDRADAGAIRPLAAEAALPVVLRHGYLARFGHAALTGGAGARHFRQAVAAAMAGGVARLSVPDGLDRIDGVQGMVLRDLGPAP